MKTETNQRILLVTPQPFYEDRGTPIAISLVLEALTELGYEVDVLAYPLGSQLIMDGVRILRCANPIGIRSVPIGFSWRKAILDVFLAAELRQLLKQRRYACIHAVEEAALIATCLNGSSRPPVIYDMASALPEALLAEPLFRLPGMMTLAKSLERLAFRRASHITCSKGLGDYVTLRAAGAVVTEWSFPGAATASDAGGRARLRRELHIADDAVVCAYTGSFALYQGLDVVIEAIPRILDTAPNTVFLLVGSTADERPPWQLGTPTRDALRIIDRQPRERIGAYLEAADVLLSPRASGMNAPLKIFDYLSTVKPVLASDVDAHRGVADHSRVHLFVHSPDGFAAAVLKLLAENPANTVGTVEKGDRGWAGFRDQVEAVYRSVLMAPSPTTN